MKKNFVTDCGGIQSNEGITELVFILDKSGSMAGMEKDTIGGFNAMIEKQKMQDGKVYVSTVLFSNFSEVLHDRKSLEEIPSWCLQSRPLPEIHVQADRPSCSK